MKQLIAFTGLKGSGKDTAAEVLLGYGFKVIKFADPLKAMMRAYLRTNGIPEDMIEMYVEGDLKETCLDEWEGCSTRYAMQTIGTEWGRYKIGDSLWVNSFKRRAAVHDLVVCTDVRFNDEVNVIRSLGGKVYRIARPGQENNDMHESERGIILLNVAGEIVNDGSIADLRAKVKRIILRE